MFLMLVTGGPPVTGGGGMPRIMISSVPASALRIPGAGQSGKTPHWREVADVAIDDMEEPDDRFLGAVLLRPLGEAAGTDSNHPA